MPFEPKIDIDKKSLLKFLLLLAILLVYFGYLSWKYGFATGGLVAGLTWSFFVLCTPIADAGFLLDFPVRLVTGMRMVYTEILVWTIAIGMNAFSLMHSPDSYQSEFLTDLLHKIITNPWPYWSIPALCALGTFLSVYFGDGLIDEVEQVAEGDDADLPKLSPKQEKRKRIRLVVIAALVLAIISVYYHLISSLGINF